MAFTDCLAKRPSLFGFRRFWHYLRSFFAVYQFFRVQRISSSERRLDAAQRGVRQAYEVLQNERPTRQIAWVNAARLILRANALADSLTEDVHDREWRLFVEEWRVAFLEFLQADHTYYFGIGPFERFPDYINISHVDLEDIAERVADERSITIDGYSSSLYSDFILSERAIKVIYEFSRSYDPDDDPILSRQIFSELDIEDVGNSHLNGLIAFLRIRRRYSFSGGEYRIRDTED